MIRLQAPGANLTTPRFCRLAPDTFKHGPGVGNDDGENEGVVRAGANPLACGSSSDHAIIISQTRSLA